MGWSFLSKNNILYLQRWIRCSLLFCLQMPLLDQIKSTMQLVFLHLEYSHESVSARRVYLSLISSTGTCSLKSIARMCFFSKSAFTYTSQYRRANIVWRLQANQSSYSEDILPPTTVIFTWNKGVSYTWLGIKRNS